ncbi:MAG: glycosyltransferase family 2 protein [Paraglaciecola sp.]|uniref:glycosyltransferase family 2 protein n=1 Tax=Paraglaciecola sp. TaxID=1920173 RepID=UPI00329806DB
MATITVQILTFNEERHIERAIDSVQAFASQVIVIDSFSNDKTVELAKAKGAVVLQNKWKNNHAYQFNWGLKNAPVTGDWVMRLDADEYITKELAEEIKSNIDNLSEEISGIYMRRRIHFLGQWMKHGATYPMWVLRLWRNGHGQCENRWMDEHIVLNTGKSARFNHDFIDDNLNDLTWWTNKHNHYATREAADLLNHKYHFMKADTRDEDDKEQAMVKRWLKENIYSKLPLFVRPFFYFLYRYVIRLGFMDGWRGLQWNFLQGLWYRFLVDAKIFEAEAKIKSAANQHEAAKLLVMEDWGLNPPEESEE